MSNFNANQHLGYSEVAAPASTSLTWKLLYSRTANYLPLVKFELSENEPCLLSGAFKIDRDVSEENLSGRTRDEYSLSVCPKPIEKLLEKTFREASSTVTVNEQEWMQETGILDKIDSLPDTDWEAWAIKKAQNQFRLWQRSMDSWSAECNSS